MGRESAPNWYCCDGELVDVYWALLAVIAVERVAELVVSQRHAAASLRNGGVEYGKGHFPVMVALHVALLVGCVAEPLLLHRTFIPALGYPMLVVVVAANALTVSSADAIIMRFLDLGFIDSPCALLE